MVTQWSSFGHSAYRDNPFSDDEKPRSHTNHAPHIISNAQDISKSDDSQEASLPLALIQLGTLKEVGMPLISASIDVQIRNMATQGAQPLSTRLQEDAKTLSSLVKTSMSLIRHVAGAVPVNNPEKSIAIKMGLASFVSPIVADYYKLHMALPEEKGVFEILEKIDAVTKVIDLDHWAEEVSEKMLFNPLALNRESQRSNQLEASLPIIQAVSRFSFGLNPDQLIKDALARVVGAAENLSLRICEREPSLKRDPAIASVLNKAAAQLYADCHFEEVERLSLMAEQEQQRYIRHYGGNYSLEPVWQAFEARLHMLFIIADHLNFQDKTKMPNAA